MLRASKVILGDPSALGIITIFETHGAGWFIGYSSIIYWLILLTLDHEGGMVLNVDLYQLVLPLSLCVV